MKVLSLFDGMSCARIALDRAAIPVTSYKASELDKYAIKVSHANYPDIEQLGDVCDVKAKDVGKIDLLIGGSPCQDLSFAGKGIILADKLEDGVTDRAKSHCLDANYFKGGNLKSYFEKHRRQLVFKEFLKDDWPLLDHAKYKYLSHLSFRKLTPLECERLQTVPDNYTNHVSNTQRYKMLGNGFTVDVVAHILKGLH